MSNILIKNGITIPEHELEITASRSGGAGGQHVNKTSSRITIRWNVKNSAALTPEQRERVVQKLQSRLTNEGDLIIHCSTSRSQQQNKQTALNQLVHILKTALTVPKKRTKTRISQGIKEARRTTKSKRSLLKKVRSKKIEYD